MPHELSLITTIAAALGLALILGLLVSRLKMPPLIGYLLAGVAIGPATPGFVADVHLAGQLAEIGVMLLMFGVGLHFSVEDLLSVRRIAVRRLVVEDLVMVRIARTVNPGIEVVLRSHSEDEADLLRRENTGTVFLGEHELAHGMARHVSARMRPEPAASGNASRMGAD